MRLLEIVPSMARLTVELACQLFPASSVPGAACRDRGGYQESHSPDSIEMRAHYHDGTVHNSAPVRAAPRDVRLRGLSINDRY